MKTFIREKFCPSLSVSCAPKKYPVMKNCFSRNQVAETKTYSDLFQLLTTDNISILLCEKSCIKRTTSIKNVSFLGDQFWQD